jgi:hypothetical protein
LGQRRGCGSGYRGCGNGRNRQAHDFSDGEFDATAIIRIVLQELAGIFAALAKSFALEREPRPALVNDVLFDCNVEQIAFARLTLHDV